MRLWILVGLVFFVGLAFAQCTVTASNIVVGTDDECSDGIAVDDAIVYVGEDYYVCGELSSSGSVRAYHSQVMPDQTVSTTENDFSLHGVADTTQHLVYYINFELVSPCEKTFDPIRVEVQNKCIQLPPSTIQAIPNSVENGEEFELYVSNAEKELYMVVTGLNAPLNATIEAATEWTQTFNSEDCCEEPPCSCELKFSFVDPKHTICSNDVTSITVNVKEESGSVLELEGTGVLFFVIAGVVVIIALIVFVVHKYL